jgi:hypothetical protein
MYRMAMIAMIMPLPTGVDRAKYVVSKVGRLM